MARPLPSTESQSVEKWTPLPLLTVLLLACGYALLFGWLSLERYWAYEMHALDMGNMGQAAWNTLHGHPFYFTNMRLPYDIEAWGTTTRLSFHVETIFPLLSLTYLIYPHPESLLVLQTAALALGAIPVFFLARAVTRSAWLAVVLVVCYLLFPSLQAMNLYEFHPVSLATPLLLAAFYFAYRRRYVLFGLCSLLAIGTKEEIGLVVALLGLYIGLVNRDRSIGLGTAVAGVLYSLLAAVVVEHHFRPPGTRSYMQTRYGYLGHGLHGVLHTALTDPLTLPQHVATWAKAAYIAQLAAPTGFLALFAAPYLVLGATTLALNLLSTDFHMYSALGDNSAELIAVVMIASTFGARTVIDLLRRVDSRVPATAMVGLAVLAVALYNERLNGFAPFGARYRVPAIGSHQRIEDRFVSMIPASVPISTQDQLDPHLSSRRYLYLFADTGRLPNPPLVPANFILLDASATTYPLPSPQLYRQAQEYLRRPGWGVAAAQDGLILIEKGARSKRIPSSFYTFMRARARPTHPLHAVIHGIDVLGYDVSQVDLVNYRIPRLAYTLYLRPLHGLTGDWQPVVYERMGSTVSTCAHVPLGLAWLPTSRWQAGRTYAVRMDPMETDWPQPATARLSVTLQPTPREDFPTCSSLWPHRNQLLPAGTFTISF